MKEEDIFFERIRSYGLSETLPPNVDLFRQGQSIQGLFLLDQGEVKLTRAEPGDVEIITEISRPIQLLGATSILGRSPSTVTVATLTTCFGYSINVHLFLRLIELEPELSRVLLKLISQYSCQQVIRHYELGRKTARCRLAKFLLTYLPAGPHHNSAGRIRINVPLKKIDLAKLLAITPEQLSRILSELKANGIIDQERGWIVVTNLVSLIQEAERL